MARKKPVNPHKEEAGYQKAKYNEISGAFCVLYDAEKAGFEVSSSGKWVVFCSCHGVLVAHENKQVASELLRDPKRWCNVCKQIIAVEEAEKLLNIRHARCDEEQMLMWAKLAKGNPEKIALFEKIYGEDPSECLEKYA